MSHVDESQLTAYLDQEFEYADPENRRELGRHIADCLQCMKRLKEVRSNRQSAQGLLDSSAPPAAPAPPFDTIVQRAQSLPPRGAAPAAAAPPPAPTADPTPSEPAPSAPPISEAPTVPLTAIPSNPLAPEEMIPPAPPAPVDPVTATEDEDEDEDDAFEIDIPQIDDPVAPPAETTPPVEASLADPTPVATPDPIPEPAIDDVDIELPVAETAPLETTAAPGEDFEIDLPGPEISEPVPPAPAPETPSAEFTIDLPVIDDADDAPAAADEDFSLDLPTPEMLEPPREPVAEIPEPVIEPEPEPEIEEPIAPVADLPLINPDATGSMLAITDVPEEPVAPEPPAEVEIIGSQESAAPEANLEVPPVEPVAEPGGSDDATMDFIHSLGPTEAGPPANPPVVGEPEVSPPTEGGFELESVTDWDSGPADDAPSAPPPPLELESVSLDPGEAAPPPTIPPLGLETTSLAAEVPEAPPPPPLEPMAPPPDELAGLQDSLVPGPEPQVPDLTDPKGQDGLVAGPPPVASEPAVPARDSGWDEPLPPVADDLADRRARAEADAESRPRRPWDPPEDEEDSSFGAPAATVTDERPARPSAGTFEKALGGGGSGGGGSRSSRGSSTKKWLPIAAVAIIAVGAGGAWQMGLLGGADASLDLADQRQQSPTQLAAASETPTEAEATPPQAAPAVVDSPPVGPAAPTQPANQPVALGLAENQVVDSLAGGRGAPADSGPSAAQQMLAQVTDSAARVAEDLDAAAVQSRVVTDTTAQAEAPARREAAPAVQLPDAPPVAESLNREGLSFDEAEGLLGGPVIIVRDLPVTSMTRIGTTDGVRVVQTDQAGREITLDVAPSGGAGDIAGLNSVSAFDAGGNASTGTARFGPYRISARGQVPADVMRGYLQRLTEAPGAD